MKIGIIVAMEKELKLLLPLLSERTETTYRGETFYTGRVNGHEIAVMQCGIGKVNAGVGTFMLIDGFNPELIINTGVAGGADPSIHVMDAVVATRVAYHDVYCGPEIESGAVQGLVKYFPTVTEDFAKSLEGMEHVHFGLICSGDQFIDTIEAVQKIKSDYADALAVDMESAAIAQVCYKQHVPFVSLRVISDSPGASSYDQAQYYDFWEDAPRFTFSIVKQLLENA